MLARICMGKTFFFENSQPLPIYTFSIPDSSETSCTGHHFVWIYTHIHIYLDVTAKLPDFLIFIIRSYISSSIYHFNLYFDFCRHTHVIFKET